jgi:hypothetical protein
VAGSDVAHEAAATSYDWSLATAALIAFRPQRPISVGITGNWTHLLAGPRMQAVGPLPRIGTIKMLQCARLV